MLLKTTNLTKSYGGVTIFSNVQWTINLGDKVGLIGRNGSGKTTFLKTITKQDTDFNGEIIKANNCQIGYLSQEMKWDIEKTLFDECLNHFSHLLKMKQQISDLEHQLQETPHDMELHSKYGDLLHQFEDGEGYDIENKVQRVLTGLGFSEEDIRRPISTLSGGEQRRGLLGKLLLSNVNLLILDEPTNHLDIFSIRWLESFLKEYEGAIILVSHDRHFLNSVVNKIIEMRDKTIHSYSGNYNFYLKEKESRFLAQEKAFEQQQKHIEKEEEFIRRNIAGQKTKQAQSRRKALEKLDRIGKPSLEKEFHFRFSSDIAHFNQIIDAKDLNLAFGDRVIINDFSIKVEKGDKIGIVGRNGTGKSTLIKALIQPEHQNVKLNPQIRLGYFSQGTQDLDYSKTLFDTIHDKSPYLSEQDVRSYLARFDFSGEDVFKEVGQLSGGEKTRLVLLNTVLSPADFLVLDEPTNHLDIHARSVLGYALKDFPGTVMVVSHDRSFLDQFTNRILLIAQGQAYFFYNNYSENEDKILQILKDPSLLAKKTNSLKQLDEPDKPKAQKKKVNIFKIQKLEQEIENLEAEKEKLAQELSQDGIYSQYEKLQGIESALKEVNKQLEKKYAEWEQFSS